MSSPFLVKEATFLTFCTVVKCRHYLQYNRRRSLCRPRPRRAILVVVTCHWRYQTLRAVKSGRSNPLHFLSTIPSSPPQTPSGVSLLAPLSQYEPFLHFTYPLVVDLLTPRGTVCLPMLTFIGLLRWAKRRVRKGVSETRSAEQLRNK